MKYLVLIFALLLTTSASFIVPNTAIKAATPAPTAVSFAPQSSFPIQRLTPGGMPLSITGASFSNLNGQPAVRFSFANANQVSLAEIQATLYVLDYTNRPTGAIRWIIRDLFPADEFQFDFNPSVITVSSPRFALALNSVTVQPAARVSEAPLTEYYVEDFELPLLLDGQPITVKQKIATELTQHPCTKASNDAAAACAAQGKDLGSFSCIKKKNSNNYTISSTCVSK